MATNFDTGIPSIGQVQMMIRDKKTVEAKLTTGDVITGNILWQDANAVCMTAANQTVILMRGAIAYLKTGT